MVRLLHFYKLSHQNFAKIRLFIFFNLIMGNFSCLGYFLIKLSQRMVVFKTMTLGDADAAKVLQYSIPISEDQV